MPVIRSTLASWRKLPFWLRLLPKIANFNQGRLSFLRADAFMTRSRRSSNVRLSVVKLLAAKSGKNVTWTLWTPMSSSAAIGSPLGGLGLYAFTGTSLQPRGRRDIPVSESDRQACAGRALRGPVVDFGFDVGVA